VSRLEIPEAFSIGKAIVRQGGDDVALVCTGHILERVLEAGSELRRKGISARVIDMHTVKPLDVEVLEAAAQQCGCIVTCEEHNVICGLGSMVAACLAGVCPVPIRMVGIQDAFGQSGSYTDLQTDYGLSPTAIVEVAEQVIAQKEK
jgi:transketolase